MEKIFFLLSIITISVYAQKKELPHSMITKPMNSDWINYLNNNGKTIYSSKLNNTSLNGKYIINETKLNTNTDIVNSYYNTGYKFIGSFIRGYKNGLWKTSYKNKLVKTINYNNGLIAGKYRVYNTKGVILYKTTFGTQGNGKYKDFYYKTGMLKEEGNYENGKKEGEWCTYNQQGNTKEIVYYKNGTIIKK